MAEFTNEIKTDEWQVLTDEGYKDFSGIGKTIPYDVYLAKFNSGRTLECADDHLVVDNFNDSCCIIDLEQGDPIKCKDGLDYFKSIEKTSVKEPMYDLLDVDGSVYYTNDILSHNSTTFAVFVCHYILFNEHKNVVILANKEKQSKELLARIQLAYENLPFWMQQDVKVWNKTVLELANGCKVVASSTSSDTVRGESISVLVVDESLYGDSLLTVRDRETGAIKNITIEQLYDEL